MKFSDVVLPDWVGVLGSALAVAVITAAAMPASSDELGRQRAEPTSSASKSPLPGPTVRDESQP